MEKQDTNSEDITKGEKDSKRAERLLTESERLMPELRTLTYCQQRAVEKGYTQDFQAVKNGLQCIASQVTYLSKDVTIVDFYRFEGITDPADMAVLYAIEANDGTKGTLVDAYGTYADADVAKVMMEIESIGKKNGHSPTGY